MALIFPQCSFTLSPLTQSNKGSLQLVHGHQMRVSQLKQGGKHTKSVTTCAVRQGVPGSTVVPAEFPAVKRSDFPVDFVFGGSTSAVQSEGAADVDGRTPSTWDYILTQQGYTDGPLSYVNYKEDVKLLKQMGVDVYRFSISWSRLLPKGRGEINPKAKEFYNNLINELRANGIEPFVTIFHLDLPVALVNEYNGFLDVKIVEDFKHFSDTCFLHFGDRVKYWGTINEPDVYAQFGYKPGMVGPDDPARYPYIVAKNIILAHATAVRHYKKFYQGPQRGVIGMTVSLVWMEPYQKGSKVDKEAAERAFAFHTDLFVEPFVYGDYPFIIKALVRDRLPAFTAAEKELIKGAYDFVGVNYYTARYTRSLPISPNDVPADMDKDQYLDLLEIGPDGQHIGDEIAKEIYSVPDGLREGLVKLKEHYGNTPIYITENGCADISTPNHEVPDDGYRITFMNTHLKAVKDAMSLGANVKSYIHWSMIDVVELGGGYDVRLGLNHVNYDNFERTPKKSAKWYKEFLKKNPR